MKTNLLTTVIFLLINLNVFSQPSWTRVLDAKNHNRSTAIDNALLNDSIILHAGFIGHGGYTLPSYVLNSLIAYDLQGNILWHTDSYISGWKDIGSEMLMAEKLHATKGIKSPIISPGGLFEVISVNSDQIYAAGYYQDYWSGGYLSILKLDKNGDLIFQNKHFWDNPESEGIIPVTMDVYEGVEILIGLDDNTIVKTDSLGQVVWVKNYDLDIEQIEFINENRFFIMSSGSLYLADMEGNILNSVGFGDGCLNSILHNDTIYQLFSSKLVRLDTDINILDTIYNSNDISLNSIKSFQEDLWLMGFKDQEIKMIKIENQTASEPLTFDKHVELPDFLISGSQILFTGTSRSGQMAVYSYDIDDEPENYMWPDIEIVNFTISNTEYEYDNYSNPNPVAFTFDTEMTIYNNSDEIIESFAVFTYLMKFGFDGYKHFYYNIFKDYTLYPYQEITFSLPRMKKHVPPSHSNEFCFELLAPNSKIEPNINNNILCKTFDIVGIEDFHHDNNFIVYPNPAKNHLYVNFTNEVPGIVTLIDSNGRKVYEKTAIESNFMLDISALKPGLYLMSIMANNEQITKKIIKR